MKRPPFPSTGSAYEILMWRLAFDLMWVCANLVKITDKASNKFIPFVFNDVQMWVYWNIRDQQLRDLPVRLWILKGRQFGISTMCIIRQFLLTVFQGQYCLVLVHKEKPGKRMFAKVERAFKTIPKQIIDDDGTVKVLIADPTSFETGTELKWETEDFAAMIARESAENIDAGVSETYQHAHLTEVPLWANADHTMAGFFPTVAEEPNTTVIGEFTARGEGDYTHGQWLQSKAPDGVFRGLFLPWYWHNLYSRPVKPHDPPFTTEELRYRKMIMTLGSQYPLKRGTLTLLPEFAEINRRREIRADDLVKGFRLSDEQLMWRRYKIKEFRGDIDKFRREYPATDTEAWQAAGRRVIPPSVADKLDVAGTKVPELDRGEYEVVRGSGGKARRQYKARDDGRVWRWERPQADAFYVIGADTSSGVGLDSSAAHVLRVSYQFLDLVASFEGKVRPYEFARILARMGSHYRCYAEWDPLKQKFKPSSGTPALLVVEANRHGTNVIYELTQTLKYSRLWKDDKRGKDSRWKHGTEFGFDVNKSNKMDMLNHLGHLAFDDQIRIACSRTRQQVRGLQYLDDMDDTAGAPPGAHDDMAMSIGEAAYAASRRSEFRKPEYARAVSF